MRFPRAKREYVVVSVGGSLIVPEGIDVPFLKRFRELITAKTREGFSFFIITGGGRTARKYQQAVEEVRGDLTRDDIDWLGIHSTRLNAHLMRSVFMEDAQARIVKNPSRRLTPRAPIVIGAGWKPGWSTDYCAVMAAQSLGASKLVNLSDIDYVYTANPKEDPSAKPLERLSWKEFRDLIPSEWDPGLSSPFDPVAAKEAERMELEVAILNGEKLEEFDNYLSGKSFTGSVIS
ncbi:MAG TPA: UMP kinase [Candidatus Paceibacterota bacterium]|nr:UMP kinase [Candidatus Paceibacterota bacterium]